MTRFLTLGFGIFLTLVPNVGLTADQELKFERHKFTLSRQRGIIRFDGVPVDKQAVANGDQRIRLIETFDGLSFDDDLDFRRWARGLRGARTYTYDDVIKTNQDGMIDRQPLVLLPVAQQPAANAQWRAWLARKVDEARQPDATFSGRELISSLAESLSGSTSNLSRRRTYATDRVLEDALDLWDVRLVPSTQETFGVGHVAFNRGVFFRSPSYQDEIAVRVIAVDSEIAVRKAIRQNPGYRLSSARKL